MALTLQALWQEYRNHPFEGEREFLNEFTDLVHVVFLAGASAAYRHLDTGGTVTSLRHEIEKNIAPYEGRN